MAISHRTNRLKLVGTPAVEQLQNGRYQLTVNCTTMNSREDWYSANKARIFPDFGSLESAEMSIDGLAPRTGEAYTDMRLVSVQSSTQQEKYIVTLVYQTLGASFVQVKDDTVNYIENGLRRVTRTSIAKAGTDFQKTVGATSITSQIDGETAVTCILASYEVDDTDSYREVTEIYIEAGTLSETEDKVGSQLAIVKETFASTPATPSGYSVASTQESNVDGIPTKRYTFLKENIKLSESEDKVGSQLTKVEEWFKPDTEPGIEDYVIANVQRSNVKGIPTEKYTFLKENVKLSESEDKVGSQLAKVEEWFKPETKPEIEDYVIAKVEKSNMGGIPTEKYTFLKENVELSRSEDKVGSQKAILTEVFKPENDPDEGDHVVAKEETSNVQGIPTKRFTFLLPNTVISRTTDDRKGFEEDQFALTKEIIQVFKPEEDPNPTISTSVLISKEVSNEEGMPTEVFTFVNGKGEISNTESNADPALPSAVRERTIVHLGEPENEPEGVVVSKKIEQQDGYEVHTIISLENEIEGVTNEYDDYIEVEVPGEVELIEEEVSSGGVTGTIALVKVQPKRILRKLAKVKVEIIKGRGNIPAIEDPAYDLGEISCSVTSTNLQLSIGPGSTVTIGAGTNNIISDTGYVQDFKVQTSITNYPGHFLKDELLAEGSIEYISSSQPVASGNSISRNEDTVTRKTKLVGTGCSESEKSDSWREFGEISRSVRPVLVDFDGVEYYEVRTITIDPSGSSQ